MGVAIVVSAILILYALMIWRVSSEFQEIGYHKTEIVLVFVGSILFGIAEIWTIFKSMQPTEGVHILAKCLTIAYTMLTIWRAANYRIIWKKIVVILISAIAITIGYLA